MEQLLAESHPGISRLWWARSEPLAHEVELTPRVYCGWHGNAWLSEAAIASP
jgi:hypothetical protein